MFKKVRLQNVPFPVVVIVHEECECRCEKRKENRTPELAPALTEGKTVDGKWCEAKVIGVVVKFVVRRYGGCSVHGGG